MANENMHMFMPMLKAYPEEIVQDFMFMGSTNKTGTKIFHYKHTGTREYIYIDAEGQTYNEDFYKETPAHAILQAVGDFYAE